MNNSWKIAAAFIVVFLAGGATAAIFTLRYAKPPPPERPLPLPEQFGPNLTRRWVFSKQLDLTPTQRSKIMPIIVDSAEDLRRLNRESAHSSELIIDHMLDEVAVQLNPDQRNKYNDLIANTRQKMAQALQNRQRQALKLEERQQQAH